MKGSRFSEGRGAGDSSLRQSSRKPEPAQHLMPHRRARLPG